MKYDASPRGMKSMEYMDRWFKNSQREKAEMLRGGTPATSPGGKDRVTNKTLHLVRVFVSNLSPGQEFTLISLGKKLQTMSGFDPEGLKPALKRLRGEGSIERVDDVKGKRWRAATRADTPAEAKLSLKGLTGGVIRPEVGRLAERFIVPPFSVLDARSGAWRSRKDQWLRLGIQSEVGRGGQLLGGLGESSVWHASGTSIFDPVLCEAVYRWFSPVGGQVVDPFAGGSVRGIVAGELARKYWGVDLRQEQVDANKAQLKTLKTALEPKWVCGDAEEWVPVAPKADLVFTCPPYGDLEKYSDDPRDLSNMTQEEMLKKYGDIIEHAAKRLKKNRFFVIIVGDYRDKKGILQNFVSGTIQECLAAGLKLYNEAILITAYTSVPMRAAKQFVPSRKLGKTHQNILVFVKGDPRKAAKVCREGLPKLKVKKARVAIED